MIGLVGGCDGHEVDDQVGGDGLLVPPVWDFSVAAGCSIIGILGVVGLSLSNGLTISLSDTVTSSLEPTVGGVWFAIRLGIYLFQ